MGLSLNCDRLYQVAPPTAHAYTVTSLLHLFMQVRLYSLAGHLQQHESAFTDQPLVVQRLPSKLSSLAWDHNQNVGLPSVVLPFMSGPLHDAGLHCKP